MEQLRKALNNMANTAMIGGMRREIWRSHELLCQYFEMRQAPTNILSLMNVFKKACLVTAKELTTYQVVYIHHRLRFQAYADSRLIDNFTKGKVSIKDWMVENTHGSQFIVVRINYSHFNQNELPSMEIMHWKYDHVKHIMYYQDTDGKNHNLERLGDEM